MVLASIVSRIEPVVHEEGTFRLAFGGHVCPVRSAKMGGGGRGVCRTDSFAAKVRSREQTILNILGLVNRSLCQLQVAELKLLKFFDKLSGRSHNLLFLLKVGI